MTVATNSTVKVERVDEIAPIKVIFGKTDIYLTLIEAELALANFNGMRNRTIRAFDMPSAFACEMTVGETLSDVKVVFTMNKFEVIGEQHVISEEDFVEMHIDIGLIVSKIRQTVEITVDGGTVHFNLAGHQFSIGIGAKKILHEMDYVLQGDEPRCRVATGYGLTSNGILIAHTDNYHPLDEVKLTIAVRNALEQLDQ